MQKVKNVYRFNKGEWSEIYTILYLLANPRVKIVDSNLNIINDKTFEVQEITLKSKSNISYKIEDDNIFRVENNNKQCKFSRFEIQTEVKRFLNDIETQAPHRGSFELPERMIFLNRFIGNSNFKAKATSKSDFTIKMFNKLKNHLVDLDYSVKSSLGSPATILNSSKHTNFKYRIDNFSDKLMNEVNRIDSRSKLIDRIKAIKSNGGIISFVSILSSAFLHNLTMIKDSLPTELANALLWSYEYNVKDLKDAYGKANYNTDTLNEHLTLISFLNGISFGFVPSKIWNGKFEIDGGLFIVCENGDVVLLDLVEHSKEVERYLINNTRLDSPSSTRYHMVEIYKEDNNYFFTLNLQLRYK